MFIDLSQNVLWSIITVCLTLYALSWLHRGRISEHQASLEAWRAWKEVSEKAIEKGQSAPPPPALPKR